MALPCATPRRHEGAASRRSVVLQTDDVVEAGRWKSDTVDAACHSLQPLEVRRVRDPE